MMRTLDTERLGAWLDAYHDTIRGVVEDHRGNVLESIADSVVAVFARAADALRAGIALLRALDAATWPDEARRVRVGIHTDDAARWRSGHTASVA